MRLVLLKDHQQLLSTCLTMYTDFFLELELCDHKNREAAMKECQRTLQERLIDSSRQIFLFEQGRSIVGFAEVAIEERCFPDEDLPESCARVIALYIVPHVRGQKLGSGFFKLIRDWARDQKAAILEVEVPALLLPAQQFFSHQGLELVGTGVRNCYRSFT